jgi:DNA invertase Pin-like site-specific DNA recombinase
MGRYVTYLRLSRDSRSGKNYGLDAQRRDLDLFLGSCCVDVDGCHEVASYTEIQSGADDDRPELIKAIGHARREGACLLISRLDRLSRRVSCIATLLEAKDLDFRVASMPHASKFELHIYAALAEQEREFISARTKAGLAAARARGVKLGGLRAGTEARNAGTQAKATASAEALRPLLTPMVEARYSLRRMAEALHSSGHCSRSGKALSPAQVKRYLNRLQLV